MSRLEALVSGFGGQGVVTAGRALGLAAVRAGLRASMLISHGTETRGGYVRSQVVISEEPIDSPLVERPDVLCALSQAAWWRFAGSVGDGLAIYDPDLVEPNLSRVPGEEAIAPARLLAVPARRLAADKLGAPLSANMVALGAMVGSLGELIGLEAAETAVSELSGRGAEVNLAALRLGWEIAKGI